MTASVPQSDPTSSNLPAPRKHSRRHVLRISASLIATVFCIAAVPCVFAQNPNPAAAEKPLQTDTQKQPLPHPTTTVVVQGEVKDDYLSAGTSAVNLDGATLLETPLSVTSVSRAVLSDQMARVLADVVKNDASVGEDYAPVGYYGDFQIRGFPLDLATGVQINGMTVAGEQDIPLENIERVEFVKGIAGVESGVASAGGLINYTTKEPYAGQRVAFDAATDHRGSAFGTLDFGRIFHTQFEPGVRVNLAGESIRTYVQHADGWRGMGAVDSSFRIDPNTNLYADFAYQHKVQRSEAGYQLLGGVTVPTRVFPSVMLGYQPWSKPNTFDAVNAGTRLQHTFNAKWSTRVSGSYSRSMIDDNVIWPYGPALDADGNSLCPDAPYYFFCPDGSYEIYDYRSPGEVWMDVVGDALVQGSFATGKVTHQVVGGGSLFHRTVDLSPTTAFAPLGVENIYQPNVQYAPEDPYERPDPSVLADFNHQAAGIVQDRMQLPGGISLLAGGRVARVTDFNDSGAHTQWLPQYAVTYSPRQSVTLYGNYGVLLSLGPQAPWWVDNSAEFLPPYRTRQTEAGIKYEHNILLTASVFRMRQPFFYPRVIQQADSFCPGDVAAGDLCFESAGHETHTGVELNAQGKAAGWLQLTASLAAIHAVSTDTGTPAFNSKQVINVPRVHTTVFADMLLPHLGGLHLMPGWSYTASKEATRDDTVSVSGYNLFNLGARYSPGGEESHVTLRLYADNIFNKRYWKDTGASYGDTFLHLGAPATVRLSAHYTF